MHISVVTSNIIFATAVFCGAAAALPAPQVVPVSICDYAGQFICVSDTVFALCDTTLTGVQMNLAQGDPRCQGKGENSQQFGKSFWEGDSSATSGVHGGPQGSTHGGQPVY
jgi:hypothetical protein